ncbi:MAG: hypothetical protein V3R25_01520 [Nitrosomonadaceae bacterium]
MNELALARVIHLLGVVLWIGGVAMITTILLPAIAKMQSAAEKIEFFNTSKTASLPRRALPH